MINKMKQLFPRILVAAVIVFSITIARAELRPLEQTKGKAELKIFGDVKTVLDGQSTGPLFAEVDASQYLLALGCASITDDPKFQGETFFIKGTAFVKSVDAKTSYAT